MDRQASSVVSAAGPRVVVEVLALRLTACGHLAYRLEAVGLGGDAPDAAALRAAGVTAATAAAGTVSHSTSWRYTGDGAVVLTYALTPDPAVDLPAQILAPGGVVCSPRPLHPSPGDVHDHHVAAHAVRHLAQLAATDPTVAVAAARHPELWRELVRYGRRVVVATPGGHGLTYEQALRRDRERQS